MISFDASELGITEVYTIDFGDGQKVAARQHHKGGGWVAETAHVDEDCFVGPFALVYGNAHITGKAIVNDYAKVYGDAKVYGNAKVYGDAQVFEGAQVYGNARVSGHAKVYGDSRVIDNALVYDHAQVFGSAIIRNNAEVLNTAQVYGVGDVYDSLNIYDCSIVTRKPKACYGFEYNVTITDHHICLGCAVMPSSFLEKTGRRVMRMLNYEPDVIADYLKAIRFVADLHGCVDRPEDVENFDERKLLTDLLNARIGVS
jgi:carbonic anhydrase/acetyltransferase-like protein (isoleucine patch superfamily)